MPETPGFEEIARGLVDRRFEDTTLALKPETYTPWRQALVRAVADELRQVWNARGAADLTKLETELMAVMGAKSSGPYVKNLERALRSLDR
jgi:hypothetical protein